VILDVRSAGEFGAGHVPVALNIGLGGQFASWAGSLIPMTSSIVIVADSPIEDEFVWTMRNVGIDHILLGSDYPQYTLEQNVSALDRLNLDESEKAKIRLKNARRLFGREQH